MVTESFLPRVNGVTNSVCRVLEHLERRGHEALIIAPGPGPESYAGFPVTVVPGVGLPGYNSFVLGLPTKAVERRLREFAPDVVHLASPVALGAAGARAARKMGVPSVAVFQTDLAGFARRYGFRGTDKTIWSWLRHVHRQAARTLVPSSATYRQLDERGFPGLAMWRRGVDAERFQPSRRSESLRRELAPNGEVLVGFVGRLASEKRVELLACLADVPNVKVVVVGEGPAEKKLRTMLPDAAFLGFLDGQRLAEAYASLDVFVHTGPDETFCQAIQEAMASGLPVVAPAAGGPLDLVTPEETGLLFEPNDTEALRAGVVRLAEGAALRTAWGAAGRLSVEHRSWSAVGDELLRHYSEVCRGRVPLGGPQAPAIDRLAKVYELGGEGREAAAA
ncbi:MAG TPA: glycosyltransferase family 1 protein [Actinospica sp.]|nr:glycosyltransferase family 1 protein [Actinospica sp.]